MPRHREKSKGTKARSNTGGQRNLSILVVDEDRAFLDAAGRELKARGCEVALAKGAKAGIRKANQKRFDAVIVDIALPGRDALTLLGLMRVQHDTNQLKVFARLGERYIELYEVGVEQVRARLIDWDGIVKTIR